MKKEYDPEPLKKLIEKARKERKWLVSTYQQLWFSPDELETANNEGRFCWRPTNWTLQDPLDLVEEKFDIVKKAQRDLKETMDRVRKWEMEYNDENWEVENNDEKQ
jgi:hypothetical protein